MKVLIALLGVAILATAVPVFAQGPFTDVPTDHWAYDAVNSLQKDGIVIGYPDGTFSGKRTITRYEFAVAIARLVGMLPAGTTASQPVQQPPVDLSPYVKKIDLPDFSKFATKDEVQALKRLLDEFQAELAALGTDVDALKRDVAALDCRVSQLENEQRRVKITGDANVFAIATAHRSGEVPAFDRDERVIPLTDTLGRSISTVRDFDLNIVGRVTCTTTANATINYGNYLNYLTAVDDYVDGLRPTSRNDTQSFGPGLLTHDFVDNFFPYYLYISTALGKGAMSVGRFPMQFTPYTFKKIDVDSYTSILKTDDGNYPVDGIRVGYNFGGVDLTLYAAKHDSNDYLANGLTSQPRAGIYDLANIPGAKPMNSLGGNSVGGLPSLITQSAGARAVLGIPWNGNLGLTYYQAWSATDFAIGTPYDQAQVYGADISLPFGNNFAFSGSWTQSNTLAASGFAVDDIDFDNQALDGALNFSFGKLGMGLGYKHVGRNFTAAGAWDKIGRWTNPTNVKGPYARMNYPFMSKVSLVLNGEWLQVIDPSVNTGNTRLTADDIVAKAEGGIRWGLSKSNALDLGYEWVRYNPDTPGFTEATETYLTIGLASQFGDAGFKVGYQFINYLPGNSPTFAYGSEVYRAGLGVVQFGVSF